MKVIIGLGNPGDKYQNTRHNIGFVITGELAERFGISAKNESKFSALVGKGNIKGHSILIVQPLTYMNLSGESISKVLNWYKLTYEDILVVYDDIALDMGRIRYRPSGSDGGHNGIKSIIQHLGGNSKFDRLKVGIGPDPGGAVRKDFVLGKFTPAEKELLQKVVDASIQSIEVWLDSGLSEASNRFNGFDASQPT